MKCLNTNEIKRALKQLPGWRGTPRALTKTVVFPNFLAGIQFINRVARIAEKRDHHPDITIHYRRIRFSLSTHSAGGVTRKDVVLARDIEKLLKK